MVEERLQTWERVLESHGVRITPQREEILRYLAQSRTHPTAYEVYEAVRAVFPRVARATVYNTLNLMVDLGLLIELKRQEGAVRYETDLSPHINLICMRCGQVIDAPLTQPLDLSHIQDFEIRYVRVDVYGICAQCQQNATPTTPDKHTVREEEA